MVKMKRTTIPNMKQKLKTVKPKCHRKQGLNKKLFSGRDFLVHLNMLNLSWFVAIMKYLFKSNNTQTYHAYLLYCQTK